MGLEDVIARLEAAPRQDRRLDEEIATAVWGEPQPSGNYGEARTLYWWHDGFSRSVAPEFTGSLDAALTLLPEGWDWKIISRTHFPYQARWPFEAIAERGDLRIPIRRRMIPGFGLTGPLALCSACLRARASDM